MNRRSLFSTAILAGGMLLPLKPHDLRGMDVSGIAAAQKRVTWRDSRENPTIQYSIRVSWYPDDLGNLEGVGRLQSKERLEFWQRYPEDQFVKILGVEVFRALSWAEYPLPPVGKNPRYDNVYWVRRDADVGPCIFSSCRNMFIEQVATHSRSARRGMEGMSSPTDALISDVLDRMGTIPSDSPLEEISSFLPTQEHLDECGLSIKVLDEYEEF